MVFYDNPAIIITVVFIAGCNTNRSGAINTYWNLYMNNKLALIVGVGYRNGVGGALCASLLQSGVNVIAVGRSQEKLDSLSQDLAQLDCKGKFFTLVSDVSNEEKIEEIFEAVDDKDMLCDLLVYNAAEPNIPKNFLEMKPEYLRKMWHTNWLTAALVSQQAISRMLPNNRGTLIYT
jgi:NADP-dependent 3-hydroxy acid dehydrogenase YdfG